jgi:hypothetical protein
VTVDDLVEEYGKALHRLAKANAEESSAEETRKVVLAQQIVAAGDVAVSKAENIARASAPYAKALVTLDFARTEAEEARAEVEWLKVRWETWRTKTSYDKERIRHDG